MQLRGGVIPPKSLPICVLRTVRPTAIGRLAPNDELSLSTQPGVAAPERNRSLPRIEWLKGGYRISVDPV